MPSLNIPLTIDTTDAKSSIETLVNDIKSLDESLNDSVIGELIKRGARNSKNDVARIQNVHDHSVGLGALCHPGNTPEEDDEEAAPPAKPTKKPSMSKAAEGQEPSDQAEALGIPLDTLVSAVQSSFWDLRTQARLAQKPFGVDPHDYWDYDDDMIPSCVAVYDGYAIARIALAHFKVPYTVANAGVVLANQGEWEQVTQDWVTKNVPMSLLKAFQFREIGSVKNLGGGRLGNYLVVWGDDTQRDLYGEYFTQKTEGLKAIFDYIGKVPALYQHAMDGQVKYTPVGVIDTMEIDAIGLWTETQLDMANQYAGAVQQLARKKALGASSGTLPGARKAAPDGEITQWVIIEGSFTPTPAEPRMRELSVAEVKAIYTELNLELPQEIRDVNATGVEETQVDTIALDLEREQLQLLALAL